MDNLVTVRKHRFQRSSQNHQRDVFKTAVAVLGGWTTHMFSPARQGELTSISDRLTTRHKHDKGVASEMALENWSVSGVDHATPCSSAATLAVTLTVTNTSSGVPETILGVSGRILASSGSASARWCDEHATAPTNTHS